MSLSEELVGQLEKLIQAYPTFGYRRLWALLRFQHGSPTQNAFIDRFNRTYRHEVLNLYLFRSLEQVRELTAEWITIYNEHRPHDALQGAAPCTYHNPTPEHSIYDLSV